MLIYGTRTKGELVPDIAPFTDYCPMCRANRTFRVKTPVKRFTLYFVPTIKIGGGNERYQECSTCETAYVYDPERAGTSSGDAFFMLVISAIACVVKADGKVLREEIEASLEAICSLFKIEDEERRMWVLNLLSNEVQESRTPPEEIAKKLGGQVEDETIAKMLLDTLLMIGLADGELHKSEVALAAKFARFMNLNANDVKQAVRRVSDYFAPDEDDSTDESDQIQAACSILGVSPSATVSEIKAAYRGMVANHHPDRVAHLGPELQELAKQKTKEINDAYQFLLHRTKNAPPDSRQTEKYSHDEHQPTQETQPPKEPTPEPTPNRNDIWHTREPKPEASNQPRERTRPDEGTSNVHQQENGNESERKDRTTVESSKESLEWAHHALLAALIGACFLLAPIWQNLAVRDAAKDVIESPSAAVTPPLAPELAGKSKGTRTQIFDDEGYRLWTSVEGEPNFYAKLLEAGDGNVVLVDGRGREKSVPICTLTPVDLDWLIQRLLPEEQEQVLGSVDSLPPNEKPSSDVANHGSPTAGHSPPPRTADSKVGVQESSGSAFDQSESPEAARSQEATLRLTEKQVKQGFRIWTDKSGKFSTVAKYVDFSSKGVVLLKTNGRTTTVDLHRLCQVDQDWISDEIWEIPHEKNDRTAPASSTFGRNLEAEGYRFISAFDGEGKWYRFFKKHYSISARDYIVQLRSSEGSLVSIALGELPPAVREWVEEESSSNFRYRRKP